ncbi:single-stranded DNA-binding protein [Brachybacterium sp. JHP9]|uniref:Single-stranded DNA-binding protein n=1 Tax=Brachybacterium equifaecis TaxID=2910770 RepID=A0ABT0R3Q0_9MICO|nr:single-stranded DNA-binding protein [Brachybacterium equifaecis]MCL6424374.1 single-stranded DNA-binding protein [Brachybacterium equifaecis]
MDLNQITHSGNLTGDPRKFVAEDGKVLAYFTIAVNPPKRRDAGPNDPAPEAMFVDCVVYEPTSKNVLETYRKGMAVIAIGGYTAKKQQFFKQDGSPVNISTQQFRVFKTGPDLTFATASVNKIEYQGGGNNAQGAPGGQGFGQPQGPQGGFGQPQGQAQAQQGFGQPQGQQGGFGQPQGQGQPQGGFGQGQPQGQQGFGQPQGQGQPQQGFDQGQQAQGGFGQPQGQQNAFAQQGQGGFGGQGF